jgi:hypothetical protein
MKIRAPSGVELTAINPLSAAAAQEGRRRSAPRVHNITNPKTLPVRVFLGTLQEVI